MCTERGPQEILRITVWSKRLVDAFNYPQFAIRRACEESDVTALQ